ASASASSKLLDDGYKTFRGGIKWPGENPNVPYSINTSSIPDGIDESAAAAEIAASFETWDTATSVDLFYDTWGITETTEATFDEENVVSWDELDYPNAIAVCTFWVDTRTKTILEFDITFSTDFDWGIGDILKMDISNIATHEIGHTLILKDLYIEELNEMTMYGYSTEGETKKCSLEPGDIAGLQALYGS
ncbi:MAG: matrixin family metalloprotease, partial [Chloroflexota bacterium]